MSTMWASIIVLALGAYTLKLAGLSLPPGLLERPLVRRLAVALPVALLAALVAVQVVADAGRLTLDARMPALAVAAALLALRANFLVVVVAAATTAAVLRALLV